MTADETTPLVIYTHFLNLPNFLALNLFCNFLPNQTGSPIIIDGTAIAAIKKNKTCKLNNSF
jgi:hypothetical protein